MSDTPAPLSREALEARREALSTQRVENLQAAENARQAASRCEGAIALLNEQIAGLGPAAVEEPAAEPEATA